MSRPTTKSELAEAAQAQFFKLWQLIDSMTENEQTAPFDFPEISTGKEAHWKRDKNIRDVLIHLYEWHQLLLSFVASNQQGNAQPFLPEPYTWMTYGDMNVEFWKKHQTTPHSDARELLLKSHAEVMELIEAFTNQELFEKKHFDWTGTTSLGSYCVSATSSHYDWAQKKIKRHIKALG